MTRSIRLLLLSITDYGILLFVGSWNSQKWCITICLTICVLPNLILNSLSIIASISSQHSGTLWWKTLKVLGYVQHSFRTPAVIADYSCCGQLPWGSRWATYPPQRCELPTHEANSTAKLRNELHLCNFTFVSCQRLPLVQILNEVDEVLLIKT